MSTEIPKQKCQAGGQINKTGDREQVNARKITKKY